METVPRDVLHSIGMKLDLSDLLRWCLSEKRILNSIYNNDNFWMNRLKRDYPDYETFSINSLCFKEKYFFLYGISQIKKLLKTDKSEYDIFLKKNLDLSFKILGFLPKLSTFNNLSNLQYLSLSNNHLTEIPSFNLPDLRHLHLSGNKLRKIPSFDLPNLQELYLGGNELTEIPSFNLPNLQILSLSSNKLKEVPPFNLPNLRELYLTCNELTRIPLFNLPDLQKLHLSYNRLTEFPSFNFPNLEELYLNGNYLSEGIKKWIRQKYNYVLL